MDPSSHILGDKAACPARQGALPLGKARGQVNRYAAAQQFEIVGREVTVIPTPNITLTLRRVRAENCEKTPRCAIMTTRLQPIDRHKEQRQHTLIPY